MSGSHTEAVGARACYDRVRVSLLAVTLVLLVCSLVEPYLGLQARGLTYFLFYRQDRVLVPLSIAILVLRPRPTSANCSDGAVWTSLTSGWFPCLAAVGLTIACWAGRYLVFGGYNLSRDEQMADFDATIYRHAHAVWPISPDWSPFADSLNQLYMQPVGDHEAWVSNYLPINAAIRALFGSIGLIDLTGPAFAALGLCCLWSIAKRLWPEDRLAPAVAIALYLGSSQIVITGMTAYAMNAHIGLNMLWLWFFLRGSRMNHAAAMLVGLLATGIHQPLFHPLFVLPFLYLLARQGRRRTLAAYCAAYLAIGAIWVAWPVWISAHGVLPIPTSAGPVAVGLMDRVAILGVHISTLVLMAMNLVRFITWQHLLLAPLASLGIFVGWRNDPIARSLALGLLLPLLVVPLLVPYQGHGWGYRYLHGVIGNACLLGTGGFIWLRARGLSFARPMIWSTLASVLIILPVHLVMARRQVAPYRDIDRTIAASRADVVIVDNDGAPFAQDLVINRPDLSNRPIRLLGGFIRPSSVAALCRGGSVQFLDAPQLAGITQLFGLPAPSAPTPHQVAVKLAAISAGCNRP